MKKPFVFGVAVEEENFVGRSEEITVLSNNFKYGVADSTSKCKFTTSFCKSTLLVLRN